MLHLYVLAILRFPGSSQHFTIFFEDLRAENTPFLHVDSVYFAKQHLRHQDLLFIGGEWSDTVRAVALHMLCRDVCVCVDAFCKACISLPIQKLFLPSFLTSSLLLLLADKKMAVATVVPRNRHCFLSHC